MTQNIKNFIEEGNREFDLIPQPDKLSDLPYYNKAILNFISSRQISLIKMIIEMVESRKDNKVFGIPIVVSENPNTSKDYSDGFTYGFNQALDTITSKLEELIKE